MTRPVEVRRSAHENNMFIFSKIDHILLEVQALSNAADEEEVREAVRGILKENLSKLDYYPLTLTYLIELLEEVHDDWTSIPL